MSRKKVLIVTAKYFPYVGGASIYFKEFVVDNLKKDFNFFVLTTNNFQAKQSKLLFSIPTIETQSPILYKLAFIWLSISSFFLTTILVLKYKIDIIHTHSTSGLCFGASLAAKLWGKLLIKDLRDIKTSVINLKFPEPNRFICLEGSCRKYALKHGVKKNKLVATKLPFEIPHRSIKRIIRIGNAGLASNKLKFLFLGEIIKSKGIEIITNMAEDFPHYQFILAGPFPQKRILEKLNSAKNIIMLGKIVHSKVFELIKNIDFLLLPSEHEGIPSSVIEALAMQKPIILNEKGVLKEFFKNTKGIFFSDFSKLSIQKIINSYQQIKITKNEYRKFTVSKKQYKQVLSNLYLRKRL